MATFPEQVKEMGVKQAIIAKTDDLVERMTSGLNVSDIRGMLRGDEPRRPNPRLRPHADGFWLHIKPSFYHTEVTHIYPTFRLGWLSTFMFMWETITGIFLMLFYTPEPDTAFADIWNILSNVPLGSLMRDLHRLGAEIMVFVVAAHMLRTFITGSYKKPRQFAWITGVLLLVLTAVLSFTGYLLPWDQLAYWAVTVAVSAVESHPGPAFIGENLNLLIRGAPTIGAGGLLRFYLVHVLALPLITGIFIFVHYYKVIVHGHSLPPGREEIGEDTAKRVPKDERVYFLPDVLTNEMMWTALTTLVIVAASAWFYEAPLENHSNGGVTPLHVVAPWYLAWSQGWLKFIFKLPEFLGGAEFDSKLIINFVMIPILALAFAFWPYYEVGKSRRYADRRKGLSLAMFFIAFMWTSVWMGSPEWKVQGSAEQEVMQHLLPQEGHSVLLKVPYDELQPGIYLPGQVVAGAPELTAALQEFLHSMENYSCKADVNNSNLSLYRGGHFEDCEVTTTDGGTVLYANSFKPSVMPDPYAQLEIKQFQHNMVSLELTFEAVEPGTDELRVNDHVKQYRHEDSVRH